MKVKIVGNVLPPKAGREGDAGLDVYSPIDCVIPAGQRLQVKLGLALQIQPDEVCILSERSGMAIKHGLTSIGNVVDSNYRGEISIILLNSSDQDYHFIQGDRIGQLLIMKLGNRDVKVVQELDSSERGESAHYSSGT